ncbi:heat shock protein Hsp20 [Fimbriimonas ginsengisoli Gsoil 348]|uniref:Heat shock protein Hsp20 n=2 Tax=Fimbriimonas ginsengisoli TaxID=1005039 RepID=A0A068NRT7_FIMGI|nr:heat shock protein Hsp20 [Fimbriimonas ginsengisoli Gsoil 348]
MWNLMDRFSQTRSDNIGSSTFPIDIFERDGRITIRASLPGVKPEDLNVSMDQGVLTITGETKDDLERREGNRVYHREHSFGRFVRSVRIPEEVNENAIDANFENGVLTVSMPITKPQQPQPRQIAVRSGSSSAPAIDAGKGKSDFAYADQGKADTSDQREKAGKKG